MSYRSAVCSLNVTVFLIAVIATPSAGQDASLIISRATILGRTPALAMQVSMSIHRSTGAKERKLELYLSRSGGPAERTRLMAHVVSPAFLNQMKFLSHRNPDGEDATWLKTSGGVRRLSQSNRDERLFDSDFTVEDLTDLSPDRYELLFVGTEDVDGVTCDVVRALRLPGREEQRVLYVGRADSLIRRVDVLGAGGRLARRYTVDRTQLIDGVLYPLVCTMRGSSDDAYTVLRFDRIEPVGALPDKLFSQANL
jgi:hypothetical protein